MPLIYRLTAGPVVLSLAALAACGQSVPASETATKAVRQEPPPEPAAEDEETYGLPPGEGREEVIAICGACHSMKLVVQQGLTRDQWAKVLDRMVTEQGLPRLEPDMEARVLDYLSENLDPESQKERLRKRGIIR